MSRIKLLSFLAGFLAAAGVSAHDSWLRADTVNLNPGDKLTLHLILGEDLVPENEIALASKDIERFELYHGNAVDNLFEQGHEGEKPLWSQVPDFESEYLAVMTRGKQQIEMPSADFAGVLVEEGVSGIAPTARATQRARLWRFLKLLGRVGTDDEGSLHHRFIGQQLEIVLIQNPVLMKSGDEQIVQVYFETKPLANQTVFALHRNGEKLSRLRATTDARGVARFRPDEPGLWLVKTTSIRACKKCDDADWEAYMAAYVFELPQ